MTKKILLIGCNGQLGWECQRTLACQGELTCLDYPQIDLRHPQGLAGLVQTLRPDLIINSAAYTAVDKAEVESEAAYAINAEAPGVLAQAAREVQAALIHFSTDYVFDGNKGKEYLEGDSSHPLNVYGKSKLAGEEQVLAAGGAALILRTSWVYSMRGNSSFVSKALAWSHQQEVVKVVTDQIASPTWARLLAEITAQLVGQAGEDAFDWIGQRAGLYHLAGSGSASRFDVARLAIELDPQKATQVCKSLQGALTSDFPTPAQRPLFTGLDCSLFKQTFNMQLPPWQSALKLALEK